MTNFAQKRIPFLGRIDFKILGPRFQDFAPPKKEVLRQNLRKQLSNSEFCTLEIPLCAKFHLKQRIFETWDKFA